MAIDLRAPLEQATLVARRAGELLRADLHRSGGPRGAGDKAEADTEAERLVRGWLLGGFPGWGFLGEETGYAPGHPGEPLWLVDPNDGTRDYLKGRRGSAVSIALLVDGVPRLGVVFAFAFPDDAGDLFAWAEGCGPLLRNGRPVQPLPARGLGSLDVVLVSSAADSDPTGNLACVTPARYRAVPSIAHRLALVAAGEAAAAVSLNFPSAWDYGAGHALLRGAGATLIDEQGRGVAYGADGRSRCASAFGGREETIRILPSRPWHTLGMTAKDPESDGVPVRPAKGRAVTDTGRLARAQGCLLGQLAGDNLGALVEFDTAEAVRQRHADGPRLLSDGGRWGILAGQPTDDSEMALALARSIVARGAFEREAAAEAYRAWLRSSPFDVGVTVGAALRDQPNPASQANGSLMRVSPLGVYVHAMAPALAAELGRQDSTLTHPNPVCGDAAAAFVVAVGHAVREGDGPAAAFGAALEWARGAGASILVREALEAARHEAPRCDTGSEGWVKVALQNAFHELLHASSLEEGVVATVRRGGDTDTNAAIAGALLGAVHGRDAVPGQWRSMILSCRPLSPRAERPRPRAYWPVDVLEIAERLLLAGEQGGRPPARG
ncbi:MAG TPA: inositol monophosphatase family protein [Vicinamibacteria bacterium]|jgi:ADP-ribosylglycohydrolase/fructose-1,6-bisphosphatase/inositol monophosphatase family enzyme|nr:inositol monophosphatase family protein [Vicinamibacteria bacterium]